MTQTAPADRQRRKPHIVAIDDNQDILHLLEDILTYEGYRVTGYTTPSRAMGNMGEDKPDLIILDWMFGQNEAGMHLLQRLKLRPSTAQVPLLICSAATKHIRDAERLLSAKSVRVIYKPFDVPKLLDIVHELLQPAGDPALVNQPSGT